RNPRPDPLRSVERGVRTITTLAPSTAAASSRGGSGPRGPRAPHRDPPLVAVRRPSGATGKEASHGLVRHRTLQPRADRAGRPPDRRLRRSHRRGRGRAPSLSAVARRAAVVASLALCHPAGGAAAPAAGAGGRLRLRLPAAAGFPARAVGRPA